MMEHLVRLMVGSALRSTDQGYGRSWPHLYGDMTVEILRHKSILRFNLLSRSTPHPSLTGFPSLAVSDYHE